MSLMSGFDSTKYEPVFGYLFGQPRLMPLGPGSPTPEVQSQLRDLTIENAIAATKIVDQDMAKCCLAGLWLYHNYLDESHTLSQEIETPTGSYWHGFMHRREPDYGNAKYWFRRIGAHPIYAALAVAAKEIASSDPPLPATFLARQTAWDPFAFVDLCETAAGRDAEMLCRQIQQREWELLFDFCYSKATGAADD